MYVCSRPRIRFGTVRHRNRDCAGSAFDKSTPRWTEPRTSRRVPLAQGPVQHHRIQLVPGKFGTVSVKNAASTKNWHVVQLLLASLGPISGSVSKGEVRQVRTTTTHWVTMIRRLHALPSLPDLIRRRQRKGRCVRTDSGTGDALRTSIRHRYRATQNTGTRETIDD